MSFTENLYIYSLECISHKSVVLFIPYTKEVFNRYKKKKLSKKNFANKNICEPFMHCVVSVLSIIQCIISKLY